MNELPERVSVITFDGDQTLWDFRGAMHSALECVLEHLKSKVSSAVLDDLTAVDLVRIRDQVAREMEPLGRTYEEIRRASFGRVLSLAAITPDNPLHSPLRDELYELYMEKRYSLIELYPGVLTTLQTLSKRYPVGLITNGNTYPDRFGLAYRFDFAVFSEEVGARKPDPRIFRLAASRAGCAPPEMLHVGDQLGTDVAGAKRVGAVAAWLNQEGLSRPADIERDVEPDIEIRELSELLDISGLRPTAGR